MDTIFINTENSKTNESNRFRLYFTNKLDLRRNKTISLAHFSIYYMWENIKPSYNNNEFKISGPNGQILLIYLMDPMNYQIFKIIFKK